MSLHQQALHLVSYLGLIKRCLLAYRSADEPAPTSFVLCFLIRLDQTLPASLSSADEPAPTSSTLSFLFRLDQTLPTGLSFCR